MLDRISEPSKFVHPPGRTIAGCAALAGFSVSVLVGLSVGNSVELTLERAIFSMLGCFLIGRIAGSIFEYVIRHSLIEFFESHPVPDSTVAVDELVEQRRRQNAGPNAVTSPDVSASVQI